MIRRRSSLYVGAALLASCSFVTDSCACVTVPSTLQVVGTITVAGGGEDIVSLLARTHRGACGSAVSGSVMDHGAQNVQVGTYRYAAFAEEGMQCAILTASIGQRSKRDSVSVVASFGTDSSRLDLLIP